MQQFARGPEADKMGQAVAVDEDTAEVQIAVHHEALVGVVQGSKNRADKRDALAQAEALEFAMPVEGQAFNVFDGKPGQGPGIEGGIDESGDGGVLERGERALFVAQAVDGGVERNSAVRRLEARKFDGDGLGEVVEAFGAVEDAVRSFGDGVEEAEWAGNRVRRDAGQRGTGVRWAGLHLSSGDVSTAARGAQTTAGRKGLPTGARVEDSNKAAGCGAEIREPNERPAALVGAAGPSPTGKAGYGRPVTPRVESVPHTMLVP